MCYEGHLRVDGLEQKKEDLKIFERKWKMSMMRRAMSSYFRQGGNAFPCPYLSSIVGHDGIYYAYLANSSGTLAVYRIRGENSFSKKARRWPKAIEVIPASRKGMALYTEMRHAGLVSH